ncbi:sugar phosphate isomerase/epimerase family protein [Bacillus gobiensis]|uniref:sugar phosphate isomerase/epimerase family protein n=2 Tax=Bacillus gobiensis TaxID=1441095 RepID=UPI003D255879
MMNLVPQILFSSTLAWSLPVEEIVPFAKASGIDGLEIWSEHVWHYRSDPQLIHKNNNFELNFTLHAPSWDLNIASLDQEIREASIARIFHSIELADRIGAGSITFHPGQATLPVLGTEYYEEILLESVDKIVQKAKQYGKTMSLELMEEKPKEFITSPAVLNHFIQSCHTALRTTFDVAHIKSSQDPVAAFAETARVDKIHLSDNLNTRLHVPLGTGIIDRESIHYFLTQVPLPIVIEGLDPSPSLDWWHINLYYVRKLFFPEEQEVFG